MIIIEQSLIPKDPKRKSEDGIVVTPDFIAVIDGSTSKSELRHSFFHSNGRYAMLLVSRFIKHMPKDTSCNDFLKGVTAYVRKKYKKSQLLRLAGHPEDRITASCIIFSRLRREIWMVGDCQALVTNLPHSHNSQSPQLSQSSQSSQLPQSPLSQQESHYLDNPKPYESELAAMRSKEAKRLLSSGTTTEELLAHDIARDSIIPRMIETMQHQNNGYSVVDGFPIDKLHVRTLTLALQPWEIVLASDGYPFLCNTLEESEHRLALQREKDPLNIGPDFMATKAFRPGFNSFDDRAYIRFQI